MKARSLIVLVVMMGVVLAGVLTDNVRDATKSNVWLSSSTTSVDNEIKARNFDGTPISEARLLLYLQDEVYYLKKENQIMNESITQLKIDVEYLKARIK